MSFPGSIASIPDLLRGFGKQTGCTRYATDSEKIRLTMDYLWLRALTPALSFETFLSCYASVADYDEVNCKHPEDALRARCPRSKAAADKLGLPQWRADQVIGITTLYVDMIRTAEQQGVPVPLDFKTFLEKLGPAYLAGQFDDPPAVAAASTPARVTGRAAAAPAAVPDITAPAAAPDIAAPAAAPVASPADTAVPPLAAMPIPAPAPKRKRAGAIAVPQDMSVVKGGAAIYTNPAGRQFVGVAEDIQHDDASGRDYVVFVSADGERFEGVAIANVRGVVDTDGPLPEDPVGPVIGRARLLIPAAQYPSVAQALALTQAVGTVPLGENIWAFEHDFTDNQLPWTALLYVKNGETGPYVDACLITADPSARVVCSLPPRSQICGTYTFTTPQGRLELTVASRAPATAGVLR